MFEERNGSSDIPAVCGDCLSLSGHLDILGSSAGSNWVCHTNATVVNRSRHSLLLSEERGEETHGASLVREKVAGPKLDLPDRLLRS